VVGIAMLKCSATILKQRCGTLPYCLGSDSGL
jgi:hypothetical protein